MKIHTTVRVCIVGNDVPSFPALALANVNNECNFIDNLNKRLCAHEDNYILPKSRDPVYSNVKHDLPHCDAKN